jgi:hypothetical protein
MDCSKERFRSAPEYETSLMGVAIEPQKLSMPSTISDIGSKEISSNLISMVKLLKPPESGDKVTVFENCSGGASTILSCSNSSTATFLEALKTRKSGLSLEDVLPMPGYSQATFLDEQRWHVGFLKSHFVFDSEHF